jgi:hypothetical protein
MTGQGSSIWRVKSSTGSARWSMTRVSALRSTGIFAGPRPWSRSPTRPICSLLAHELEPDYVIEESGQTVYFLRALYISTAREGLTEADLRTPHAGDIFSCTPGVTGRPPFRFAA